MLGDVVRCRNRARRGSVAQRDCRDPVRRGNARAARKRACRGGGDRSARGVAARWRGGCLAVDRLRAGLGEWYGQERDGGRRGGDARRDQREIARVDRRGGGRGALALWWIGDAG